MKRLWGIRHIRWLYHWADFALYWRQARQILLAPAESDLRFLDDVWDGKQ